MKYLITFLLILGCIGCMDLENKSLVTNIKDMFYSYITSFDNGYNYLVDNFDFIKKFNNIGYENKFDEVMKDRYLVEHKVLPGENLDSIIKFYNSTLNDSNDIEIFREIVFVENQGKVSSNYNLQSWDYILVPSE